MSFTTTRFKNKRTNLLLNGLERPKSRLSPWCDARNGITGSYDWMVFWGVGSHWIESSRLAEQLSNCGAIGFAVWDVGDLDFFAGLLFIFLLCYN